MPTKKSYIAIISYFCLMTAGVYMITCLATGRKYVGSTKRDLNSRMIAHKSKMRKGNHHVPLLQRDHDIHGIGLFKFETLSECPPEYARKLESWYLNSIDPEYNKTSLRNGTVNSVATGIRRSIAMPVEKLDLYTGDVIDTYPSAAQAERDHGWPGDSIARVCRGKQYTKAGFRWRYLGFPEAGTADTWKKKVDCIDKETGEILGTFYSIKEASESTSAKRSAISDCLSGRNHTAGGFVWRYNIQNI